MIKKKLISDLCCTARTIDDVLYGPIQISTFATEIIDSMEFQRLREMRQLGLANFIFANATHTRYVHSIGTYYQSKELTRRLADVTPISDMDGYLRAIPELNEYIEKNYKDKYCEFDKYIQELVNISALCHDLGHGPFSHLFDDIFIEHTTLSTHANAKHEKRSQLLVEIIIKNSQFLSQRISSEHIKLIKNIIDPSESHKGFIYQIVSNYSNSLDVDKYDYIIRDMFTIGKHASFDYRRLITQAVIINNNIAYPKDCALDIQQLFQMRHYMHRQIYNHEDVVGAQLMMSDMMIKIDQLINISHSITDMNIFCKYTDSFILQFPEFLDSDLFKSTESNIEIAKEIIGLSYRFKIKKHYYPVFAFIFNDKVKLDKDIVFKDAFSQHLNDIIIYSSTVGFVSGNKSNPLDNVYFYDDIKYVNDKINSIGSTIQKNKYGITNLIPESYQEHLTIVYFKKNDDVSRKTIIPKLEEHFSNYISKYLQEYVIKYIKI
ncbi:HD domain-containing protein [Bodo saltans virus]|uniref:HD domain-containing protein n=1 Tax=Bodo saltans virus TaxID=2024608 RepID=A0A2H4UTQ6_9VIRU|nr:HD domain-containing protein [Bodo saltans virus]ATZ80237.1 HD domain-containing protein [Bodo saltans virus]